jgi:hypothetical protein
VVETLTTVALMGLANAALLWPGVLAEGYEDPRRCANDVELKLVANACLGAAYTASFLVGVAMTSPLFMSLGLVLIVPVGMVVDFCVHGIRPSAGGVGGSCLILCGFFLLTFGADAAERLRLWCRARAVGQTSDELDEGLLADEEDAAEADASIGAVDCDGYAFFEEASHVARASPVLAGTAGPLHVPVTVAAC